MIRRICLRENPRAVIMDRCFVYAICQSKFLLFFKKEVWEGELVSRCSFVKSEWYYIG